MIRKQYQESLGEHIERCIFRYIYKKACDANIELYWDSSIFTNIYLAEIQRIEKNIEINPALREQFNKSDDFMNLSDLQINDRWRHLDKTVTVIQDKYSIDHSCHKCGERKITITKVQTRGLDEGETVVYRCMACNHTWREN